ncbi:MAG TPA: cytochrome c [Myxococcaceae bacterium]|nr:cytochrome c [Myxococcaceae bacterium]
MSRRKVVTWIVGVVAALILLLALELLTGLYDVAATTPPSFLERGLAGWVVDRSVARRAPKGPMPIQVTPEILARGLAEYREHCLVCHGLPGERQSGIAAGLNPPAPDLADPESQEGSDGELFRFISAGVRMTGMPAFSKSESEETIWKLVAFVRHLPKLTDEERAALKTRRGSREEPAEKKPAP